ncbi:MAG: HNH endonuclease [Candidatus Bathyarchaeia archaeon]
MTMEKTLLLNTSYEPLSIISWKKAITLLYLGKVEVLKEYERVIRGASCEIKQPAVIRLLKLVKNNNHRNVKFSRKNIFLRDNYTCQYCGKRLDPKYLTCDHIVPKSRGGITEWSNIVTSCIECNLKKGDKLPEEAGMVLRKKPSRPTSFYMIMLHTGIKNLPELWKDYVFIKD